MAFTFFKREKKQTKNSQSLESKLSKSQSLESRTLDSRALGARSSTTISSDSKPLDSKSSKYRYLKSRSSKPETLEPNPLQVELTDSLLTNSQELNLLQIYYGSGELEKLKSYKYVAIQPAYYSDSEIQMLKASGVIPLAYLSLGEDPQDYFDTDKPYRRKRMNIDWQTHYVYVSSDEWQSKIQTIVDQYIQRGFQGFLLDSLDVIDLFPEDRRGMLYLIKYINQKLCNLKTKSKIPTYLIANRGFSLLPEMASMIDANLFEGFSTRWAQGGKNEVMSTEDLHWSALKARELEHYNIDRYSLDYCISDNSVELEHFAIERAKYYGLTPLTSNRALTEI